MIYDTHRVLKNEHKIKMLKDEHNIYTIIKTMCPPGYRHNGFVATHALMH